MTVTLCVPLTHAQKCAQSAPCEVPHAHRRVATLTALSMSSALGVRVDRPDGDLELGDADLAVAAGVDRVEDRAQLLIGEAAAAAGRARRPRARWIGVGSAESGPRTTKR